MTGRLGSSHPTSHLVRKPPWCPCQGAAHPPQGEEDQGRWRGDTARRELCLRLGHTHKTGFTFEKSPSAASLRNWNPCRMGSNPLLVTRPKGKQKPAHLAVVAPKVEVDSLRSVPVPAAVAGGEGHANNAAPVTRGQPALLVVAPSAHGLLLLTLGDAALPGQAEDVGVTAQDRPMLHRCIHTFF